MKKVKWTIVFEQEEIEDIIKQYKSGSSLKEIAEKYDVSRPTIGRILSENNVTISHVKRNSVEFITPSTTKVCTRCGRDLSLDKFSFGNGKYRRRSICKECDHSIHNVDEYRERRRKRRDEHRKNEPDYLQKELEKNRRCILRNEDSYKKYLLRGAKQRAKDKDLEFNITIDDFNLPLDCPLLGIPLRSHIGKTTENDFDSPSLDRIDPSKGYVKGNVWVISKRANRIKSDATVDELESIVVNLKKKLCDEI